MGGVRMASVTVWKARRVGQRILCGRPAPNGGCRGELALVERRSGAITISGPAGLIIHEPGPTSEVVILPLGMYEDPPGSHFWRPAVRVRRSRQVRAAALPFRRLCPTCRTVAEVDTSLLE